jgi:hypothetical protein
MDPRRLLRPIPLLVGALFVVVAVLDVRHHLATPPASMPELLETASLGFRAEEPVFDFRDPGEDGAVGDLPRLQPGGWSASERRGTWMIGGTSVFEVDLPHDRSGAVALEVRSARGPEAVTALDLTINGADIGRVEVGSQWATSSLELVPGVLHEGRNRVQLAVAESDRQAVDRPAVLVRRFGFLHRSASAANGGSLRAPAVVEPDRQAVVLRGSGTLEVEFVMHELVDALIVGYRFNEPRGGCQVVVEQVVAGRSGRGPRVLHTLLADRQQRGRLRIPLHGRRGDFRLSVRADLGRPPAPLVLSPLRFVNED